MTARFILAAGLFTTATACTPPSDLAPADIGYSTTTHSYPPPAPVHPPQKYIEPTPAIPAALHGCWDSDFDSDYPDAKSRLTIHADRIVKVSDGEPTRIARPREAQKVTPTEMIAVFADVRGDDWTTVATSLSLGPNDLGTPPGTLRLAEGDAGSYHYSRCK